MENSQYGDENTPMRNVVQNEKRKPLESPFSAFSPANRHAKKKGRILCEPGDANLEASMMDDSIRENARSDSFAITPLAARPKVLFSDGDADDMRDVLSGALDESIVDPTQTDGDRTFSIETRPYNPAPADPNLDETYADMSMNQTFSNVVVPLVPSSVDPNLDETLAESMNETFSNVVRPVVASSVDPNMDESLVETTFNTSQLSMGDDTIILGDGDDLAEDADRTLGEEDNEVKEGLEKGGSSAPSAPSLFEELNAKDGNTTVEGENAESTVAASVEFSEEINTFEMAVPVDVTVREEDEESAVEASQENSMMKEDGAMSLFDELNCQSSSESMENVQEQSMADLSMVHERGENLANEMADDSPMDESVLSTMTARGITDQSERRRYITSLKQRLLDMNISMVHKTPQTKAEKVDESTPTRSSPFFTALASPASISHDASLSETIHTSPSSASRGSRFNMNESHISFIMLEAECTNSVYNELKKDMEVLQEELAKSRELTEKVERERDNARKEVDDYLFVMETTRKKMMSEKTNLTKQIIELENELTEARRVSSVVEEEGKKVQEMESMKSLLEEQMKGLEEKMREEGEKYAAEKEKLTARTVEMERLMEEERKKVNEEMERRVMECRGELERKMEEILTQKNELINQLEKMQCEGGDKEYTNEENERRLEGEKAMMEAMMANVQREKKEMEEELEKVKREKEETTRQMMKLGGEFEAMKSAIAEIDGLRTAALEESKHSTELIGEVEELKRVNEEMKRGMEEKMREEGEKYAAEKEKLTARTVEMERLMEEERKKVNEEMERRVMECRGELERKMEEILTQKNELINQLEKMQCEGGDKEYTNEENERRLEGEKAMMEAMMANVQREKKEMEEELERVKREKEETTRQMMKLGGEFEAMKSTIAEIDGLRTAAFEVSKNSTVLAAAVEEMKRVNEEMKRGMEEKEKAMMEAMMANVQREKKEMKEELERVKREKEETTRQMMKLGGEFEAMKSAIAEIDGLRTAALEESKHSTELIGEVEELKRVNEEMKRGMEEKMREEGEKYAAEKEKLTARTVEMERLMEEERKKVNEEMERRVMECRGELERKMEEILTQKESKHSTELTGEVEELKRANEEMKRGMEEKMREEGEKYAAEKEKQTARTVEMERLMEEERKKVNEEMERRVMECRAELERKMEEILTQKESKHSTELTGEVEELKRANEEMKRGMEEKEKAISLRLAEVENEKMEVQQLMEAERERNDILSGTVKQLEEELNQMTPSTNEWDEGEKKNMEKELEEARETVDRLSKEVKRLEDTCDEFDDVEWKLKEALLEKQNKIDLLEGKKNEGGPALLDALKPTITEVKAMNETVVVEQRQTSPPREVAGKEEKEDEDMKEYGTPSGSVMDEEDRKIPDADETLGVTKIDGTKYDIDEEGYEKANETRPNASCRQS